MKLLVILFVLLALSTSVQLAQAKFSESIYSTYSQIENAILSDPKLIFKLREAFHPVITERRWQVDGVQVVPIWLCVTFNPAYEAKICGTNITVGPNTEYCKNFRWTNSYLLNLISPELLLTMDPVVYLILYSEIVRSSRSPSNVVSLTDIAINSSCVPSFNNFLSASAIVLSWSKLYATEGSGKPTKWDSKYQGYVAKWYTYFLADSHFQGLVKNNHQILYTQLGLWISFALLNILIPVVLVKRGGQIYQFIVLSRNKHILQLIFFAMSVVSAVYFTGMIVSHVKHQVQRPFIRNCDTRNYETLLVTFCHDILGMLITKAIVLPVALLIELIIAIYATRIKTSHSKCSCIALAKIFALWQLFVFVQITVGLISIPLLIMILISPAQSILITGAMCVPLFLFTFILVVTPCTKSCKYMFKSHWITLLENLVAACLVTIAFLTYYSIVSYGASMNSIKGYILSLIPTVPISIFVWMIKRKFTDKSTKQKVRKRRLKTVLQQRRASLSTEEEMMYLSDTSPDDASN